MSSISRGFRGRRRPDVDPARVPPGQYVTADFPVLSAGPTPHKSLDVWNFSIVGEVDEERGWTWEEFRALPSEEYSDGDYTTNLPLEDVTGGKAWVVYEYDGEPLQPEHGGPARMLVPHLYFWKSAKWVRGLRLLTTDEPGFWEINGYHNYGDPWKEQRYWGD
jgi:DMSO/TMAO reductase YedYZ molybdopterin-dependent catalytic subunit